MKMSRIRQIIKEELEVILTNQEVGDLFGKAVQAKLEEGWPAGAERDEAAEEEGEAESAAALAGGEEADYAASAAAPTEEGLGESNAADAADELTGGVPDAGAQMLEQNIEDLLDPESEFYEGLSGEELERAMPSPIVRNVLETIHNFILKGRMG